MNNWIIIGVVAGVAAGLLQAGGSAGSSLGLLFIYFASLPLFIAGLGWGAISAALGVLVLGIGFLLVSGWKAALAVVLSAGIAPVLLSWLALKNRPASAIPSEEGEVADSGKGIEWYPEGRLVVWTALLSAGLSILVILALGPTVDQFRTAVGEALTPMFESIAKQPNGPDKNQIEQLRGFVLLALPAALSAVWCISTMINMWLAGSILRSSGTGQRPWAPFSKLAFPRWSIWLLSGAALLTFMPGTVGAFAWVVTASMMLAYAILGLAVMHGLLEGHPMKGLLLATFYFSLLFLSAIALVPLIMLAMADQSFNIRKRKKSNQTD